MYLDKGRPTKEVTGPHWIHSLLTFCVCLYLCNFYANRGGLLSLPKKELALRQAESSGGVVSDGAMGNAMSSHCVIERFVQRTAMDLTCAHLKSLLMKLLLIKLAKDWRGEITLRTRCYRVRKTVRFHAFCGRWTWAIILPKWCLIKLKCVVIILYR